MLFWAHIIGSTNSFKYKRLIIITSLRVHSGKYFPGVFWKILAWFLNSNGNCQLGSCFFSCNSPTLIDVIQTGRHGLSAIVEQYKEYISSQIFFPPIPHRCIFFHFLFFLARGNVPFHVNTFCPLSWALYSF